ncbi:unnamed protein product [Dicrocoelium dendriticum]|nr:unnamed protein product [Dicrocoelium dendriticum]
MDSQAGGRPDAPCLLPLIAKAVKLSQELPTVNTPAFVYYNDFPHYKAVAAGQSRRILSVIQKMLDILDAKSNVLDITNTNSREKFSSIVDANDRLLERLSMAMDFEEDPSRKSSRLTAPESLVVAVEKRQHTSLEWLKNKSEAQDSDGLLRLLSSTHVRRPQSLFSTPPDNSASPFRPRLAYKPNAIRSLSLSLPDQLPDDEEAPHPYEAELAFFATALANWEPLQVTSLPAPLDTNYQFIDQPDALDMAIKELSTHLEVAVDLEHHNYRTYFGITCLIQLSTISMDYVLDALALRDHLYKLNEIFTNPKIIKVFHGSELDLMWLQRDFSVYVVNLFDTGLAARALQLGHYSLSYLLQRYANVRTCKKYQLADWRIRPLPAELIEYARTDTHYLLYIGSLLCQELQDRGLLHVVLERGRQMCLKCYTKPPFDPLGYMNLYKHAAGTNFNHRQLYALEQLYALRDSIARREDESVHYVLPNHMLKVISEVLPRESSGLFACCNPIPPLVRKYVHDLHKIVLDARDRLLSELPLTADSGLTDVAKPESEDSVVLDTSAYADLQRSQPALPHDQSGGHDTIGVQRITGAADAYISSFDFFWRDGNLLRVFYSNVDY